AHPWTHWFLAINSAVSRRHVAPCAFAPTMTSRSAGTADEEATCPDRQPAADPGPDHGIEHACAIAAATRLADRDGACARRTGAARSVDRATRGPASRAVGLSTRER